MQPAKQLSFDTIQPDFASSPLLKWPGGKRLLVRDLAPLFPVSFGQYFEAFLGGGAMYFALQPPRSILADNNADLINCYIQVRDNPKRVINCLRRLPNTEEDYYRIRESSPRKPEAKAARLIYLTSLSFNGIHRLNLKGQFNVPYGHKTHIGPCDESKILAIGAALAKTELLCADFEVALTRAGRGDVVYLDPPYTVAHGNNGFLKYNAKIFSWEDQLRLARVARGLSDRGCRVVVSNADHPSITQLYKGFGLKRVERASLISASGTFRRRITECVFFNEN